MLQINPTTFIQNLNNEFSALQFCKPNLFNLFFATQTLQNSRNVDAKIITPTVAVAGSISQLASTIDFFMTSASCGAGSILLTKGFFEFKDPFEADKKKAKYEMIGGGLMLVYTALRTAPYVLSIFFSDRDFKLPEKNASPFSVLVGLASVITPFALMRCCNPKKQFYNLSSWIVRPR